MDESRYMLRALELAQNGRYCASPNPMVGCVVVKDGRIIGEGFHRRAGLPHAEIEALSAATESTAGSTVYVNLEPCSHHGRTPPCADALIAAGVARVVTSMKDPNPLVAGSGLTRLRQNGIDVDVGLLADDAARLNEVFIHSVLTSRPFVVLKAGMTLDGKLATVAGQSRWITSDEAREASLELREQYDAILVGAGTITADDPQLTRRLALNTALSGWTRFVLDGDGSIPPTARVLSDGGATVLYTALPVAYEEAHLTAEVVSMSASEGRIDLEQILDDLGRREIRSVIVEGGPSLLSDFIARGLWQKMILFVAPMFAGGGGSNSIFADAPIQKLEEALRFQFSGCRRIGTDLMITAYPLDRQRGDNGSAPRVE